MPSDDFGGVAETPASQRLTNDDFRKLLMTPRATPAGTPAAHAPGSVREAMANAGSMPPPSTENKGELRRKKKSFYAALKKQEDTKLAELAEKYRDRARERRDGIATDDVPEDPTNNTSSAYRAVAPDLKSGMDAKERRRQLIQESKFLGGDMEHTHLVKGLDYALLQKVRSEITTREQVQEEEMERLASDAVTAQGEKEKIAKENKDKEKEAEEEIQFKTQIGRDVYNIVAAHRSDKVFRNELFAPGRMAYVVELEEEAAMESDIPTTLIRSKADVPVALDEQQTLTTNDIVINKLAQILSYLRHDRHGRKQRKLKEKPGKTTKPADESIYGEIGDYVTTATGKTSSSRDKDRDKRERDDRKKTNSYFDKPLEKEAEQAPVSLSSVIPSGAGKPPSSLLSRLAAEPEGYAECYPGLREMDDAIDDSDDEVDYSKMDAGNKKGPIGRWDFDTQEEYSAYMGSKEALPKAAFQYGVKTSDGRKTRKTNKEKNDKAELDREWQQIQNIIQKRKVPKGEEREFKKPKY